jgi:two-component system sensor histidine kinase PhoQ
MAVVLSIAQYILLRWGMRPLQLLAGDVSAIESGDRDQLQGHYPSELQPVTRNLNMLIKSERERQGRYRTTLGDLAHSLKTPLAVLSSALQETRREASLPPQQLREMEEQLARMDEIISYQLRRAVKSNHSRVLAKPVPVAAVIHKLLAALGKVYRDKAMQVETSIADDAVFYGEESDLTELCGNLLDNAFKYGRSRIGLTVKQEARILILKIDDDGKGIDEQDKQWVLQRGARADTVTTGQGIGLAVAVDIVSAYGGEIEVRRNDWGGARFIVRFEQA